MEVAAYLKHNQESIEKQCQTITSEGAKAIVTVKENGDRYVHQVSTVEKFTETLPDNKFFKKMRDAITNAVLNKVIPVVIVENKEARVVSLADYFESQD